MEHSTDTILVSGVGKTNACNVRKTPKIIGIYGIPGSGKSKTLKMLRDILPHDNFIFLEGSDVITNVVPGGLKAFHTMNETTKGVWREAAIAAVSKMCIEGHKTAIVTGHFMFWNEREEPVTVWTAGDRKHYTHILYLSPPCEVVCEYRRGDTSKPRPTFTERHILQWLDTEKALLRQICWEHGILFGLLDMSMWESSRLATFFSDLHIHDEAHNLEVATCTLESAISSPAMPGSVLVLDADRTLAPQDTGSLFWNLVADRYSNPDRKQTLKTLFSSPLAYTYQAFRQAMLLYEEIPPKDFQLLCAQVAPQVTLYPQMEKLIKGIQQEGHTAIVVMTCGLREIWEMVFKLAGLHDTIGVIGGGRISDGFVVTPAVKADLVAHLRNVHGSYVCAIGDSPMDIGMMQAADQAIVVVGEESKRSGTMDLVLQEAINNNALHASQVLLPSTVSPRLDTAQLPMMQLSNPDFIETLTRPRGLRVTHATDTEGAQLIMTETRDATKAGPVLREAHRKMGWYLAVQHLTHLIGLEEYPIPHVQGHTTQGHCLHHEAKTTIIALMRGGEPMAMGVNDAFPTAMFVHARKPEDVQAAHILGKSCVILVDSVINSGKTIVEFVHRIWEMPPVRIVVVAGVVQDQSVGQGSELRNLARTRQIDVVALRLSKNKFTGTGTTDTGNRLYNTTEMA